LLKKLVPVLKNTSKEIRAQAIGIYAQIYENIEENFSEIQKMFLADFR
jgi:hypothetical protein